MRTYWLEKKTDLTIDSSTGDYVVKVKEIYSAYISDLKNLIKTECGQNGSIYVSSTGSTTTGNYKLIHCLDKTQFAALDDDLRSTESDDITNDTIPVGAVLGGNFTKIRLVSGRIIAYE